MDFTLLQYAEGTIIALIVGLLTGIFGVGGGFLLTPALIIIGVPGEIAVGTGLAAILVSSTVGLWKRRGSKTVDVKLALTLASGSIFGVLVGIWILEHIKNMETITVFGRQQEPVEFILLCLFFLLLIWIGGFLVYDLRKHGGKVIEKHVGSFAKIKFPPYMHFSSLEEPHVSAVLTILLGFGVGVLTGLLGIGGGVMLLPALVYLIGQRAIKAAGTSLLLVWISSLVGGCGHLLKGNILWGLLIVMIIGGITGTWIGTHIGLRLRDHKLRFYFVFVVLAAVFMIGRELWKITFG